MWPQYRLKIAYLKSADVDLWLNSMDWCGSNFYYLHKSVDRTRRRSRLWKWHCSAGLATQEASLPHCCRQLVVGGAWTGRMLSKQNTDQTMHVLERWKARQCPVTDWPSIQAFQMTVPEIIVAEIISACLHCFCVLRQLQTMALM